MYYSKFPLSFPLSVYIAPYSLESKSAHLPATGTPPSSPVSVSSAPVPDLHPGMGLGFRV